MQASRPSSTQMAADTAELCHRRLVETQALGRAYHAALPVVCAALSVCARVQTTAGGEVGVVCVAPHPSNVDHVVVCTRSPTVARASNRVCTNRERVCASASTAGLQHSAKSTV